MAMPAFTRFAAMTAGAALLTACATSEGYRQTMETFVGAPSDVLLVELGPPVARDTLASGGAVWTYFREEARSDPGGYRTIPRERRITWVDNEGNERTRVEQYQDTVYEEPRYWTVECETRFILGPAGRVRDFRFQGNGCVADEIY
jgi:hypothetical protein